MATVNSAPIMFPIANTQTGMLNEPWVMWFSGNLARNAGLMAANIWFNASGSIVSTDVQSAIQELDTKKLGKSDQAFDSAALQGHPASYFLPSTGTAADSAMLGGQLPAYYATATSLAGYLALAGGTMAEGGNIALGTATGTKIGTAASQKLGFYGVTPIIQRATAAQTAVSTTSSTQTTPWGFASQSQADGIVTLLNELRAALVAVGIIKGSA